MHKHAGLIALIAVLTIAACTTDPVESASGDTPRRVLLVIADDLGLDQASMYADVATGGVSNADRIYPNMPNIKALCSAGVRFTKAWSAPTCSPTRATMLTGRYGFRTGVGWAVTKKTNLPLSETTLPELLSKVGVQHANIGKWHLGTEDAIGGDNAPTAAGWSHFAGTLDGVLTDYESWQRTVDGKTAATNTYATTANVDDAITWLGQTDPSKPWLLWLAFNAPHSPFHVPPSGLHTVQGLTPAGMKKDSIPYYRAAAEALDTELGRLLAWIDANVDGPVDIIFIGDNGSPSQVATAPFTAEHAKGSLYQGGVHVPLCISGPSVKDGGRSHDGLVGAVDLFATILGLFDTAPPKDGPVVDAVNLGSILASKSAATVRTWSYTDSFGSAGRDGGGRGKAITDGTFKLIVFEEGTKEFYNISTDPHETKNLLAGTLEPAAQTAHDTLTGQLAALK
ncbi:MAG: sulfatase-like hydrolase/transferase [Myxococcales bacterium]|nr:sulfatase-like hydrolase/transferase [Myxococcales bacterium]